MTPNNCMKTDVGYASLHPRRLCTALVGIGDALSTSGKYLA